MTIFFKKLNKKEKYLFKKLFDAHNGSDHHITSLQLMSRKL